MTAGPRGAMRLYSDTTGLDGHRVRLMLAEKGLAAEIEYVDPAAPGGLADEVLAASPAGELPALLDRDLALYGLAVIVDYIDERYPHPPFLPMDPVSRARTRLTLHRIERDWYAALPARVGEGGDAGRAAKGGGGGAAGAAADLGEALAEADEVFAAMPFFLSESYSVLDVTLVPLLWRLAHYGIVLPERAGSVAQYARRMFARPAFRASLSPEENEMRR